MYTLPPTLIVTDRGHFVAYRLHPDSGPEVIDHATFSEGVDKISEQVTDKQGSFMSGGPGGKIHSAPERQHLVAELENRCVRQIADRIQKLLQGYSGLWGFAAPAEINGPILEHLPHDQVDRLRINLPKDLARIPSHEIPEHFLRARNHA
ncbi:MAG: host attachment protein [Verrucomicrobiota bacterium]